MRFPAITLVGCGRMGSAMLQSWLKNKIPPKSITVIEPGSAKLPKKWGVNLLDAPRKGKPIEGILILAVKPQMLQDVLKTYAPLVTDKTLVISIAAGKTLDFYAKALGKTIPVVRAMPNTPCLIGKGMIGLIKNKHVSAAQKAQSEKLFAMTGSAVWLTDESKMHALTAVSGSGPAYVFYFAQLMVESAIEAGLDKKQAEILVRATVEGAGALAKGSEESLIELRKGVTSPGGTTAAAMEVFEKGGVFGKLVDDAVKAAIRRGKELE